MTGAQAATDLSYTLWLFGVSLGASALGGILGMASGIFIVPILTMFGHLDIHVAIGASIVSVIACSCGGAAPFLRGRLTNVRLAVVLETATTLGALSGVLLSGFIPVPVLFFIFAVILLLSAQQMLARRADPIASQRANASGASSWGDSLRLDSSYPDRTLGRDVDYRVQRVPLGMSLMYGAGLISALLGIGSGVLKIPAMDTALRLPIKVSSATSNFMIGVTAAASAGAYFLRGEIVTAIAGPVALGSVVGAVLGARVLMRVSSDKLRLLFVVVLAVLAVQMLLEAFGVHLSGASS
ncbi:sulfite exporter TauE/SafE family protein [Paraburkholderia sediminicola]|uniref:sulfite exporter TauE/SafE family protein n=1 Tax=Paraburkholderia sediminicola TaxID=458836 RepID=UPI0038BA7ECD